MPVRLESSTKLLVKKFHTRFWNFYFPKTLTRFFNLFILKKLINPSLASLGNTLSCSMNDFVKREIYSKICVNSFSQNLFTVLLCVYMYYMGKCYSLYVEASKISVDHLTTFDTIMIQLSIYQRNSKCNAFAIAKFIFTKKIKS